MLKTRDENEKYKIIKRFIGHILAIFFSLTFSKNGLKNSNEQVSAILLYQLINTFNTNR